LCLNYVSGQSCVNNRIFIIVLAEKEKKVHKALKERAVDICLDRDERWGERANLFNGSIIMKTLPFIGTLKPILIFTRILVLE